MTHPYYHQAALQYYRGGGGVNVAAILAARGTVTDTPPPPSILLQAIVVPEGQVPDGVLIADVGIAWFEILATLQRDPAAVHQFTWRQWEEIIAGAYTKLGFDEVILTPGANDKGRDVIATRKGYGSIRILDQVKAYTPGHLVPANDVRAMIGVLNLDRRASKGLVTTTSDFAPGVLSDPDIAALMSSRLELKNGTQLVEWLTSIQRHPS